MSNIVSKIIRDYRNPSVFELKYLFIARFITSFANQFLLFAIPLMIFTITQDVKWLGIAHFMEWVTRFASLSIAGHIVAKVSIWLLMSMNKMIHIIACFFVIIILSQVDSISALIFLAIINGFIFDLSFISFENICQQVLKKQDFYHVQSLLQIID